MKKILLCSISVAVFLSGCATIEERAAKFDTMSCEQLAVALLYENEALDDASRRAFGSGLESLLTSGEESDAADLDYELNELEAEDREDLIYEIKIRQARKGC